MNDDELLGGFLIGIVSMFVAAGCISLYVDTSWEYVERQYRQGVLLCEQLGSVPDTIDSYSVTCENGKTITWRD